MHIHNLCNLSPSVVVTFQFIATIKNHNNFPQVTEKKNRKNEQLLLIYKRYSNLLYFVYKRCWGYAEKWPGERSIASDDKIRVFHLDVWRVFRQEALVRGGPGLRSMQAAGVRRRIGAIVVKFDVRI